MRDDAVGAAVLVAAGLGAGAWLWPRRADAVSPTTATATSSSFALDLGRPVPASVRAVVTSGWSRPRGARLHRALDLPLPIGTPILALSNGVVRRVESRDRGDAGLWVGVEHADGLGSRSLHLSRVMVETGQVVRRGHVLGLSGETGNSRAPHLHLDLRVPAGLLPLVERAIGRPATGWGPAMSPWGHSIPGESFVPVDGYRADVRRDALAAGIPLREHRELRNAGLVYRPVGQRGERYPDWVRSLRGASGVYVIREAGEVVYVGQSSAGKLYETLTRHLQQWRRYKGFWRGQYGEGHDPGLTYARDSVEVAVRILPDDAALDEEARLIRRLKPRDNLVGQPADDDTPF